MLLYFFPFPLQTIDHDYVIAFNKNQSPLICQELDVNFHCPTMYICCVLLFYVLLVVISYFFLYLLPHYVVTV